MADAVDTVAGIFHQEINPNARPAEKSASDAGKPTEKVFGHLSEPTENEDDTPRPKKQAKSLEDVDEDFLDQLDEDPDAVVGDDADAGDDDNSDDADDESDKEGDEEDEDADPDLAKKYSITVDGEEKEVTVKEALEGYIRVDTFHQRLNKVQEFANGLREEAELVTAARGEMITQLEEVEKMYTEVLPPEPDWDKLYAANPAQARALEKNYRDVKAKIEEVKVKTAKAREEQAKEAAKQLAKFAEAEFPRFAQKARWKDKKHMEKDLKSMHQTALAAGFSEQEAAQVYDSRMLHVLLKASKYDRMVSNKPKPVVRNGDGAPKAGRAGNGASRTAPKRLATAQRQHERVGSIESAASVFEQQLANERRSKRRG